MSEVGWVSYETIGVGVINMRGLDRLYFEDDGREITAADFGLSEYERGPVIIKKGRSVGPSTQMWTIENE